MRACRLVPATAIAVAALALVLTGCTAPAAPKPADGKALVLSKCTACHSLDRPRGRVGLEASEWRLIVGRMEANGLVVSQEEREAIIGFLASGKPY